MTYQHVIEGFIHRLQTSPAARNVLGTPVRVKNMIGRARKRIHRAFKNDLAVDLGTSNTIIYTPDDGVVLNEPSVIALKSDTNEIIAVGREAKLALGRQASSIRVVRPIRDGVIADFDAAELMLSYFIKKALACRKFSNPRVLICAPGEVSQVERRALEDAAGRAGARYVDVVEEPIAAAIGAGFDINSGRIFMLVDIGGGTTDIAVLGYGGPVHLSTLRIGGTRMDEAVIQHIRHYHCLEIGELTAEAIKLEVASQQARQSDATIEVRGRNLKTGLPALATVKAEEIQNAIEPLMEEIIQGVRKAIEDLSPEVAASLLESGIVLTGGASQMAGLAERIAEQTGISVRHAPDVKNVAVVGAGKLFRDGSYTSIRELMAHHRAEKAEIEDEGIDYPVNWAA